MPYEMDLRQEVDNIIRDHGYYVIVVRNSPTGLRVERHQTYSASTAVPETLPRLLQPHPVGLISSSARVFYFNHNKFIRQEDWIFEVQMDRFNRVIEVQDMYKVNYVNRFREHRGRVEFVAAYCDREQGGGPDIDIKRTKYIPM